MTNPRNEVPDGPLLRHNPLTDLHKMAAAQFLKAKGRMPLDRLELIDWLMEFTLECGDLLRRSQNAFADHLRVCNSQTMVGGKPE